MPPSTSLWSWWDWGAYEVAGERGWAPGRVGGEDTALPPEEHARPLLEARAHLGQDCPANSRESHKSQQEDTALARPTVPTSLSMY